MALAPHLLHVFPTFVPAGAQVRTVQLMNALGAEFRHTVVGLDGRTSAMELIQGRDVQVETLAVEPAGGPLGGQRGARAQLARLRPDALLTYNWGAMDTVLAARAARFDRHVHHEDGFNADERDRPKARRNWTLSRMSPCR